MRKLLLGAIIGGALVYFFDGDNGGQRRRQAAGLWQARKDTVLDAARTTAGAVSAVSHEVGDLVAEIRPTGAGVSNGAAVGEGLAGSTGSN
jgi:hypothetical protein